MSLVFVVAAVAKLADRSGSRRAVIDFGAPTALATPLSILLPLTELTVSALLIPATTAWWGALGALLLLIVFVLGIAVNLARGRKPDCHCFGQLHSAPADWKTLTRNGLLAAVAGFVVWQGPGGAGPSAVGWLADLTAGQLLGFVGGLVTLGLLAAQCWFLIHLLRQNGRLLMRIEAMEARYAAAGLAPASTQAQPAAGLPAGAPAPVFELPDLHGETHTLDSLRAPGKPILLIFTDPNCGPCTTLLPEIGRWQEEYGDELAIALVSRGTPEENRARSAEHGVGRILLQQDWEVAEAYEVVGTPSAVIVRQDDVIANSLVAGPEGITALVTQAIGELRGVPSLNRGNGHAAAPGMPVGKKIGEPTPEIELPDLSGKSVGLSDFEGSEILVLFWNPGCGFCQDMLPDLREWEANSPEGAPRLLVISSGAKEANEAMGLSSPIVLDQGFTVGRALGVAGTPSTVLIDAEGKIASKVVAGATEVLALLDGSRRAEA